MIHVVGGTYLEFCRDPYWLELFGSGLRATLALKALRCDTHFSTFAAEDQKPVLLAKSEGFHLHSTKAEQTISFSYLHALSTPAIEPVGYVRRCELKPQLLEVEDHCENVLLFGMLEGTAKVNGKMVTYDPQSPSSPKAFQELGSTAERLAVVVNRTEAEAMTGIINPEDACQAIIKQGAEVAIVKCGADGCLVGTVKGIVNVPAYRTNRVWPIGSGDVFSALFAHGWMELGLEPTEAAERASKGTSYFVETRSFPNADDLLSDRYVPLERLPNAEHKKVYLAGPFFNLPQRWLIEEFKFALQQCRLQVFSPLHDVGRGEAANVYGPDIKGLEESGVVLACLDGLDPGTIYEVGYAHCLKSKVIAFVSAERPEDLKMITGGGSVITSDFASAVYLTVWAATCK